MLIFRATSLKYCYLHVLNFYLDNGVMTTPKRRILSFVFTVLSFKKSLSIPVQFKKTISVASLHKSCCWWIYYDFNRIRSGAMKPIERF